MKTNHTGYKAMRYFVVDLAYKPLLQLSNSLDRRQDNLL